MRGEGPPENRKGGLALLHSASGPANQIKRNLNEKRITERENVSRRVRRLHLSKDFLRGLQGRLGKPSGVVLDKVMNDQPPYWFVTLLKLDQTDQLLLRKHFGPRSGDGRNGTSRFLSFEQALARFEAMTPVPEWAAEIDEAQKVYLKRRERLKALQSTGRMRSPLKKVHFSTSDAIAGGPWRADVPRNPGA
jgi:hypothetical protein